MCGWSDYGHGMGALSGIRVIDLSIVVQGPQAGAMLHDLGADVVKVELPGMGDMARWILAEAGDDFSGFFEACNRGKRSVTLDLRTPGGLRAVRRLVQTADVLISNFVPGTMESWGLGYEGLAELNPRLVYAAASAFGPIGPDAGREGADLVAQAASGFISTTGRDGNEPTPMGAAISDHSGSQNLVIGILAALLHRAGSGVGQRVDVSLLGASIWAQASEYSYYLTSGRMPSRANRGHPLVRGVLRMFPTADGWIVLVGVPPHLWPGFARALERPELAADPRFNTLIISRNHLGELFDILDGIFRSRTTADWSERLGAEQQRFAAVRTYEDVVKDPQVWLNGYFVEGEHPERGRVKVVGNPFRLSATPTEPGIVAPEIGQHTEEVLLEVGFSWDEIDELRAEGAW